MVIRNKGDLLLEATNTLILSGTKVVTREGGLADRGAGKDPVSKNTPKASVEGLAEMNDAIKNIA